MKKFLVACGLALALTGLAQQEASAWCRFNFSAGINVSYEGANNCFNLLGLNCGPAPCNYAPGGWGGYPAPYAPGFAYDGYAAAPVVQPAPTAVAQPTAQPPVHQAHYSWGQTTNYAPPSYYPQNYYQPSYGYGYGNSAPSYWYGY